MERFAELNATESWHLMVGAAKKALEGEGFTLNRIPGRGLSNVWRVEKAGETRVTSIRTTRDRWIAFPPLEGGKKFKTLDDVEDVLVAAVDSKENPKSVEVYLFPAEEVRNRFAAAYDARTKAGHVNREGFGMWVNLDPDQRGIAISVGSGLAAAYKPIAAYSLDDLAASLGRLSGTKDESADEDAAGMVPSSPGDAQQRELGELEPRTIAEIMAWARQRIAAVAGVSPGAVKLDLKLEM
jgi:hypothetical protein